MGCYLIVYQYAFKERAILSDEERHIERQSECCSITTNIIISELEGMVHMIFLWVLEDGFQGLGIASSGFAFHKRTLILIAYHEVYFDAVLLVIEIEFTSHLAHEIRHQVFKDSAFVTKQITTQNIGLCVLVQHADEQAGISHIDLEMLLYGIPVQG